MFTNRFSPHCTSDGALTQFDKAPPPEMNHSSQSERAAGSFMFTPHIININSGEDVFRKIMLFCQQSPRAICIHSAEGRISTVTISHVDSSATVTYEGSFEIMALTGGFFPQKSVGGTLIRSGRMNISFANSDGLFLGGRLAGILVAASPVQVMAFSFEAEGIISTPIPAVPLSAIPMSNLYSNV